MKLIHADLKPDNIMVTSDKQRIKLCDFGSCLSVDESAPTEYLVSRFYRAPEIMLGCPFETPVDVWSAAVSLYELYTGKVMFPGRSNNEMLKLIMQTKGKIKAKLQRQSAFFDKHFSAQNPNIFMA
jgi:serine/threonine-protein kinase PRP4